MTTLVTTTNFSISFNNSARQVRLHTFANFRAFQNHDTFKHLIPVPEGQKLRMIVLLHLCTPFVGTNADEQNLSMKATVICQGEKRSPSEKRLHKGTLEY